MISRHGRGLARPSSADEYVEHLKTETFPSLLRLAGFIDAEVLRRGANEGVEFLVITRWSSMEAIRQFAGQDADAAVVPEKVKEMMIGNDLTAPLRGDISGLGRIKARRHGPTRMRRPANPSVERNSSGD